MPDRGVVTAWRAVLGCLLCSHVALAHVTPPAPKTVLIAEWPAGREQAHDAIVPLVLVVDSSGGVTDAQVEASLSPELDAAALRAAREFQFEPASDDGVPVAAKIRIVVRFVGRPVPQVQVAQSSVASAQPAVAAGSPSAVNSDTIPVTEVVVRGETPARSASEKTIDRPLIQAAPHRTAADLLHLVPGVSITQHGGEGKAYQIFYRGFDAVHGQDLEIWAGGAPVNDVSNIHGQGYADLNFLMPEIVRSIHASPGSYEPQQGDFAVAGSLRFDLGYAQEGITLEGTLGQFGTRRYFLAYRPAGTPESDFAAFETYATDGFGPSRAARRSSAVAQSVFELGKGVSTRLLGTAYVARYDSAGVLRLADVESGAVDRFATYDPKQGGDASRTSLVVDVARERDGTAWSIAPYFVLRSMRLRQNFTGFLPDSVGPDAAAADGNSEQQLNQAFSLGMRTSYRRAGHWFSASDTVEAGLSARTDWIEQSQRRVSVVSDEVTAEEVDASVRASDVGAYVDVAVHPLPRLAVRGGLRLDGLAYATEDRGGMAAGEVRSSQGAHLGKKLSIGYGLTTSLQALASYGEGFRSPQARSLAEAQSTPFTEVQSYEVGFRYVDTVVNASLAGFRTQLSEDLAFQQATARNEVTPGTRRTGFSADFVAMPAPWFVSSVSFTYSRAEFTRSGHGFAAGDLLPYASQAVLRSDLSWIPVLGTLGQYPVTARLGLATTVLAGRPLPYAEFGHDVFLVDARAALRWGALELSLDAFNLLNAEWYDGEFVYASNFTPGRAASLVPERHVTVGAPRTMWLTLSWSL
jgi:iron complex outermembrane recepter protein